jgi:hypothetical protein
VLDTCINVMHFQVIVLVGKICAQYGAFIAYKVFQIWAKIMEGMWFTRVMVIAVVSFLSRLCARIVFCIQPPRVRVGTVLPEA